MSRRGEPMCSPDIILLVIVWFVFEPNVFAQRCKERKGRIATSRQDKRSVLGNMKCNMNKSTKDTRWVTTPIRQRLVTSRKRALRSRSVKAARSVCSGHQSRELKLLKKLTAEVIPYCGRGDRIEPTAMTMDSLTRPKSWNTTRWYYSSTNPPRVESLR